MPAAQSEPHALLATKVDPECDMLVPSNLIDSIVPSCHSIAVPTPIVTGLRRVTRELSLSRRRVISNIDHR
jgi:hypothetical protein